MLLECRKVCLEKHIWVQQSMLGSKMWDFSLDNYLILHYLNWSLPPFHLFSPSLLVIRGDMHSTNLYHKLVQETVTNFLCQRFGASLLCGIQLHSAKKLLREKLMQESMTQAQATCINWQVSCTRFLSMCHHSALLLLPHQNGLHLIMHQTIGLTGYIGPLILTLVCSSVR